MDPQSLSSDPLIADVPTSQGYKVLGGVVLYQKLGQGGMGAVYRGRHLRLNIDVAVKVMDPPAGVQASRAQDFVKRFIREAQTAAAVSHQNLIRVYDVDSEGSVHFIIMDFVDGESARDRLQRKGRLPEVEAVEIALAAAEGLAEAHRTGIVHRDVKPDNIMIDKDGRVRLTDLGLAKAILGHAPDQPTPGSALTGTLTAMGTPHYMPPEQFLSARDVGFQADVWSLGVTLYQLVTEAVPWNDTSVFSLAAKIQTEPLPDPKAVCPEVSEALCDLIRTAVAKDVERRFSDGGRMADALRRHLDAIGSGHAGLLADAAAGSTRKVLISITPPQESTLTLISRSAVCRPGEPKADAPAREVSSQGREAAGDLDASPQPTSGAAAVVAPPARSPGLAARRGFVIGAIALPVIALVLFAAFAALIRPGPPPPPPVENPQWQVRPVQPPEEVRPRASDVAPPGSRMPPTPGPVPGAQRPSRQDDDPRKAAEARAASLLATARSLRAAGLPERAAERAAEALAALPDCAEAKTLLSELGAEIDARRAAERRSTEYLSRMEGALRLRTAGRLEEAGIAYRRAGELAPEGDDAARRAAAECMARHYQAAARRAEEQGNLEKALELYAKASAESPSPELNARIADLRARLEAARAREARGQRVSPLLARGGEAERAGDLERAIECYDKALAQGADVQRKLAGLRRELSRRREAEARKAACEREFARAQGHASREEWDAVAAACQKALGHLPDDPRASALLATARRKQRTAERISLDLGGGTRMELALVPAGEFLMGSPDSEHGRRRDEGPQHRVRIARRFYVGVSEVTQSQYERVAGPGPNRMPGLKAPVAMVSWEEAVEFCREVSRRTGEVVRLPTEAEWEYACRAGSSTPFHFGESLEPDQACFSGEPYAAAGRGLYRSASAAVASYQPNAWGLYDMHGNVWEWCSDWYEPGYYGTSPPDDPAGPASGAYRVVRGGSWQHPAHMCRSATRYRIRPRCQYPTCGFRVVAELRQE